MFEKVTITACLLCLASAAYRGPLAGGLPAALYPAGIDPRTCPNFPECANPAVAATQGFQLSSPYQVREPIRPRSGASYQQRYTATAIVQPDFEFMPSPARAQQYVQPQQYAAPSPPAQYVPPTQYVTPQRYVAPQQYATPSRHQQYTLEQKRALDRGEYVGDGDYHGEGLTEALAPEYQGRQQSYQVAAPTAVQYNTPDYQKVSAFLAQAQQQNVRQKPTTFSCRNYPHC